MWEEKQKEWFETMKQEEIKPSYQLVVKARRKAQEAKEKREFIEQHLPIIIICGMNVCLASVVGLVLVGRLSVWGQKSMIMNLVLGVGYLPLIVYMLATIYIKIVKIKGRN